MKILGLEKVEMCDNSQDQNKKITNKFIKKLSKKPLEELKNYDIMISNINQLIKLMN